MAILIAFIVGVAVVFGGAMLMQLLQGAAARKQRRLDPPSETVAPVVPLEDLTDEIHSLLEQGQKIAAIKLVRTHTGWGLKDAKAYVENLKREAPAPSDSPMASSPLDAVKASSGPIPVAPKDWQAEMIELLGQGRKIPAIKLVREKTDIDLMAAKAYVEDQQHRLKQQQLAEAQGITVASLQNPRITSQLGLMDYIEDCYRRDQKSLAIQAMINLNGISQDSATRQVDTCWKKWNAEGVANKKLAKLYNQPFYDSEEALRAALRSLLGQGQRIEAIKQARNHFGIPLQDAKEYVEAMATQSSEGIAAE